MNKLLLFCLLTCSISYHMPARAGILTSLYCFLLGNEDVRESYKKITIQALQDMGIQNPEGVAIKHMNGVGPALARLDLSSFTAYGIWLEEQHLDTLPEHDQLFHIYHEAAHYALQHHQKMVLGGAVALTGLAAALAIMHKHLDGKAPYIKYPALIGTAATALTAAYLYLLPALIKRQEKQADILAAATLIQGGFSDVVQTHIDQLKLFDGNTQDIWWHAVKDQIHYLESIMTAHS